MRQTSRPAAALAIALSLALLPACSSMYTTDPYTGEKELKKTDVGAEIGAIAGAGIGLLVGGGKGAAIGAGVGVLTGALAGHYMDEQADKLRAQLRGTGVSVTKRGHNIVLNMPGDVTFASGSPNINSSFYAVLNSVALVLKKYDKTIVHIVGATDDTGGRELNLKLSKERAESVASYLEGQGLQSQRVLTDGVGEAHPIATNTTAAGRAQNRRVEITIEPNREV